MFLSNRGDALHRGRGKGGRDLTSAHFAQPDDTNAHPEGLETFLALPVTCKLVSTSSCLNQLLEVLAQWHSLKKKPKNGKKPVASQEEGRQLSSGRGQSCVNSPMPWLNTPSNKARSVHTVCGDS